MKVCALAKPSEEDDGSERATIETEPEKVRAKAYDIILRTTYGDYMQLPPEKDRIHHHLYKAYLK